MTSVPGRERWWLGLGWGLTAENIFPASGSVGKKAVESKHRICTDLRVNKPSAEDADGRVLSPEALWALGRMVDTVCSMGFQFFGFVLFLRQAKTKQNCKLNIQQKNGKTKSKIKPKGI